MKQHTINIPGAMVFLNGLKAEYHIIQHNAKVAKCPFDVGVDIFPSSLDLPDPLKLLDGSGMVEIRVGTCLNWTCGPGIFGYLTARSSSSDKLAGGMVMTGIIDAGYTGELFVRVAVMRDGVDRVNRAIRTCIKNEWAIAQIIALPMIGQVLKVHTNGPPIVGSRRGSNGFGSTDLIKG